MARAALEKGVEGWGGVGWDGKIARMREGACGSVLCMCMCFGNRGMGRCEHVCACTCVCRGGGRVMVVVVDQPNYTWLIQSNRSGPK